MKWVQKGSSTVAHLPGYAFDDRHGQPRTPSPSRFLLPSILLKAVRKLIQVGAEALHRYAQVLARGIRVVKIAHQTYDGRGVVTAAVAGVVVVAVVVVVVVVGGCRWRGGKQWLA